MKIIVGISGGVDSSVTALTLKQQGHDVEALFMKNWYDETVDGDCSWEADVGDALRVCEKINIPINTVDLSADYWDKVFSAMLNEFREGLTPNPDVLCNQEIKFKAFLEHARNLGAEKIATGHYARIRESDGARYLYKSSDLNKDQSYFLCRLNQKQLSRAMFPIGGLEKTEVRRIAREHGLETHNKKDSTGICFIGERPFKEFLGQYLPFKTGLIKTLDGKVLGEHDGINFYTIGQRQGLGIGGIRNSDNAPWYVVEKDPVENILYVAQGADNPLLYSRGLEAVNMHWINEPPPDSPFNCVAKTRYRQPDQGCTVVLPDDGRARVNFKTLQKSVTPGQYVVFYRGENCLGGGIITHTWR